MTVMTHLTDEPPTQASRTWLIIGIVVTVIVLAAGLFFGYRALAGSGSPSTDTTSTTYPQEITALDVRVDAGTLAVTTGPAGTTTVQAALTWDGERPAVTQQWTGTGLSVVTTCPGSERCEVDLTITVPAGTAVTTTTDTGDATLTGLTGPVSIRTDTGEIRLSALGGQVTAATEVGSVTGEDLTAGSVTATAETGDITLGFAADPQTVVARADTGDVTVTVPRSATGYRVSADTDDGDRRVGVTQDQAAGRTIEAQTGTGDVIVG